MELPLLVLDVQLKSNLEYITKSAKLPNGCLSKLTKTHRRSNDSEDFFNVPMEIVTISNFTLNNKKILAEKTITSSHSAQKCVIFLRVNRKQYTTTISSPLYEKFEFVKVLFEIQRLIHHKYFFTVSTKQSTF